MIITFSAVLSFAEPWTGPSESYNQPLNEDESTYDSSQNTTNNSKTEN